MGVAYVRDLFSTLLHVPTWRFVVIFFLVYVTKYGIFAVLYFFQQYEAENLPPRTPPHNLEGLDTSGVGATGIGPYPGILNPGIGPGWVPGAQDLSGAPKDALNHCILGIDIDGTAPERFLQILWFTVQTSAGIGYGELRPDPRCALTNFIVMVQTIVSALQDFAMLGIIWARFSSPLHRAKTIRFSSIMTMHKSNDGEWVVSARVANIRKHQVLKPCIKAMVSIASGVATPHSSSTSGDRDPDNLEENVVLQELELQNQRACENRLWMGLPATVAHRVTPSSPLYGLSLADIEAEQVEIMLLVDGVDAMTSSLLQAQTSYQATDIRYDERFSRMLYRNGSGRLGVDFLYFEDTWTSDGREPAPRSARPVSLEYSQGGRSKAHASPLGHMPRSPAPAAVAADADGGPGSPLRRMRAAPAGAARSETSAASRGTHTGRSGDTDGASGMGRPSMDCNRSTVAAMREALDGAVQISPARKSSTSPQPKYGASGELIATGGANGSTAEGEDVISAEEHAAYVAALEESVARLRSVAAQALMQLEANTMEHSVLQVANAFGAPDEFAHLYANGDNAPGVDGDPLQDLPEYPSRSLG